MAIEYRLTLAGNIPLEQVAELATPDGVKESTQPGYPPTACADLAHTSDEARRPLAKHLPDLKQRQAIERRQKFRLINQVLRDEGQNRSALISACGGAAYLSDQVSAMRPSFASSAGMALVVAVAHQPPETACHPGQSRQAQQEAEGARPVWAVATPES
ncbi:hypothetical protein AB0875_25880 [Micromonospora gifhornensis]|uniref:hypothetical protein n=1 Tax=Micromonospora gifhornensis TaxID=84594 RepID=UPI003454F22E